MAKIDIKKGDKVDVEEITLEFDGSIDNCIFLIESEPLKASGTGSKRTGKGKIKTNGDPINLKVIIRGTIGTTIKKYTLKINGLTFTSREEFKLKTEQVEEERNIPYSFFDLNEIPLQNNNIIIAQ